MKDKHIMVILPFIELFDTVEKAVAYYSLAGYEKDTIPANRGHTILENGITRIILFPNESGGVTAQESKGYF